MLKERSHPEFLKTVAVDRQFYDESSLSDLEAALPDSRVFQIGGEQLGPSVGLTNVHCSFFLSSSGNTHDLVEDLHFRVRLAEYFSAKGPVQRKLRSEIVIGLAGSPDLGQSISTILEHVSEPTSGDNISAAIDLLSQLGHKVVLTAAQLAFSPFIRSENEAFVSAVAAGKISKELIWSVFLVSRHEAVREAAVTLLSALEVEEARPTLREIASNDQSSSIRSLAEDSLAVIGS